MEHKMKCALRKEIGYWDYYPKHFPPAIVVITTWNGQQTDKSYFLIRNALFSTKPQAPQPLRRISIEMQLKKSI